MFLTYDGTLKDILGQVYDLGPCEQFKSSQPNLGIGYLFNPSDLLNKALEECETGQVNSSMTVYEFINELNSWRNLTEDF